MLLKYLKLDIFEFKNHGGGLFSYYMLNMHFNVFLIKINKVLLNKNSVN